MEKIIGYGIMYIDSLKWYMVDGINGQPMDKKTAIHHMNEAQAYENLNRRRLMLVRLTATEGFQG